jgi:hypothetical protein
MHIRAADADRMDGDLDHARQGLERQVNVADRKFVLAFEDEGYGHGGGSG